MNETKQLFSASLAKDAVYTTGLRSFMEYRDLGVEKATHGQFRAHVIRVKKEAAGDHALHTTGLHRHLCDFQMVYVLKGWISGPGRAVSPDRRGPLRVRHAAPGGRAGAVLRRAGPA